MGLVKNRITNAQLVSRFNLYSKLHKLKTEVKFICPETIMVHFVECLLLMPEGLQSKSNKHPPELIRGMVIITIS